MTIPHSLTFKCVAAAVLTGLSLGAAAGPIAITNASFELDFTANFTSNANAITGWTNSIGSGLHRWGFGGVAFNNGITGGQTAYINGAGSSISQTLASSLQLGTYSLLVDVGDRADLPLASYAIELLAGSSQLGIITQTNFAPSAGWMTASLNYTALAGNAFLGQALTIRLSRPVGAPSGSPDFPQVNFDNVRLSHNAPVLNNVPEPGSLVLVGLALAAAGMVASRRRQDGAAR
jgi:hypothetical protein